MYVKYYGDIKMKEDEVKRFFQAGGGGSPSSLDTENRTVDIVISTATPIMEYDFRSDQVLPTIIVPEGIELPSNGQVPYIDSHDRSSTENQIGSVRNMRVEGDSLIGTTHFAKDAKSERVFQLVMEGHLTDNSIGAKVLESTILGDGDTAQYHGRTFTGPAKIIHRSRIMEVSSVPIGADENAKNRAEGSEEETKIEVTRMAEEANDEIKEDVIAPVEETERAEAPATEQAERTEVNLDEIKREARIEEAKRLAEIETICREANLPEADLERYKKEDVSVEIVRKAAFEQMVERNKPMNLNNPDSIQVTADEKDKFRSAMVDGVTQRAGVAVENAAEGSDELRNYSLVELCRKFMEREGKDAKGNNMEIVGRALSSSDFPILCGNIAHKSMLDGFTSKPESYENWCDTSGSVSDFKVHTKARASEFDDLEEVGEGEEYTYGDRIEQKEEYAVKKYGKLFTITREAIINDDLSALSDTPKNMGEAAKRLLGDLAYEVLTSNPLMGDGNALFSGAHGNLGTASNINFASYDQAELLMGLQKDIKDLRRLNIDPVYAVLPRTMKGTAEVFFQTERFADSAADATRTNIHFDAVQRVYDSRLDDFAIDDNSNVYPWFILGPKGKTVKMFFLNGQKNPFMERQDMFKVDGATWKIRIEAVAKAMLWQGMVKNPGIAL